MTKHHTIVGELQVHSPRQVLQLSVTNGTTGITNEIRIESDRHLGVPPREGERVNIGDLKGFPEARQTVGIVRKMSHTFTGDSERFTHVTTVEIDEVDF